MSIGIAFKAFFKALSNRDFSQKLSQLLNSEKTPALPTTPPAPQLPPPPSDTGALRLLELLQREGRLIDFLQEDLSQSTDAQIGAVVRATIYSGCRKVLNQYLTLEPVLNSSAEGEQVTIPEGFNPASIRLVGQVQGEPPFRGVLRHKGWKLVKAQLPEANCQDDNNIICPAEVELP